MSEWQTIETAPMDGTVILVTAVNQWPRVALFSRNRDWLMVESQGGGVPYVHTHWMSIQELPK